MAMQPAQKGEQGVFLHRPGRWVAVKIPAAQDEKEQNQSRAQHQHGPLAARWLLGKQLAQAVSRRHHAQPGQDRIAHAELASPSQRKPARLVQNNPEPVQPPQLLRLDRIQQVVPGNDQNSQQSYRPHGQKDQSGERDH